jgi:hypothetical protein
VNTIRSSISGFEVGVFIRIHRYLFLCACVLAMLVPSLLFLHHVLRLQVAIDPPAAPAGLPSIKAAVEGLVSEYMDPGGAVRKAAFSIRSLGQQDSRVLVGTDGWYYLNSGRMENRAAGVYVDREEVDEWLEKIVSLNAAVVSRGRRFLFFSAPDKVSVYPEYLPDNFGYDPARQESLDLLLDELRARGISGVDLRPTMQANKTLGPLYYKADTHWNFLGVLVAFNHIAKELDASGVVVAVDRVLDGFDDGERVSDLPQMIGGEQRFPARIPRFSEDIFSRHNYERTDLDEDGGAYRLVPLHPASVPRPFARVLMVGDSFSQTLRAPMVRLAGEYMWMHRRRLDLVPAAIDTFDPDLVMLEVVERSLK